MNLKGCCDRLLLVDFSCIGSQGDRSMSGAKMAIAIFWHWVVFAKTSDLISEIQTCDRQAFTLHNCLTFVTRANIALELGIISVRLL
jgi:hypothetical protein